MKTAKGKRKWLWMAAVAALVICGAVFVTLFAGRLFTYAPGEATGDDLDIRLVGVWPEESADIRDAGGKIIGETYGDANWSSREPSGRLLRGFLFEVDGASKDFVLLGDTRCSPSGKSSLQFRVNAGNIEEFSRGKRVLTVHAWVEKEYTTRRFPAIPFIGRLFKGVETHAVKSVDLTLRYYSGPRGKAAHVFEGPFAAGGSVAAKKDPRTTLSASEYYGNGGNWGAVLRLASAGKQFEKADLVIYDREGKRLAVGHTGEAIRRPDGTLECSVAGVAPGDIGTVAFGEKARAKTFHNITVAYPDAPERDYPEYLDEMASRLGLEDRDWRAASWHRFGMLEEVLPVIDIIRGGCIVNAEDAFENYFEGRSKHVLTPEETALLKDVLGRWALARDGRIRQAGVASGLWISQSAFVDAALDFLEDPHEEHIEVE